MTEFKNLNLNPKILAALESKGYTTPTPIQEQAIPAVLAGQDILGIAQTGTGKTAAFSLPILNNLAASGISVKSGSIRSLILTPTRELASQIAENVEAYNKGLGLKHTVIFGGVSDKPQITAIQAGVDILIATPGRLIDFLDNGYIRLMQLESLVLDEADRMLDMGFIDDIKKIISKIPQTRQTLFFSATMPPAITKLSDSILTNPKRIEIAPQSTTVDRIDQSVNFVKHYDKPKLLKHILKQESAKSVVVFCRTKHGADDVADVLSRERISVAAIHGNKDQDARDKALNGFREGTIRVLVATDVASRGIDVDGVTHVINYEIPSDPESYVHRIGRTGRAGKKGVAISFADPKDTILLPGVEKAINMKIPVDTNQPFHVGADGNSAIRSTSSENNNNRKPRNHSEKQAEGNKNKKNIVKNSNNKSKAKKASNSKTTKKGGIFSFISNLFGKKDKSTKSEKAKGNKKPVKSNKTRNNSKTNNTKSAGRANAANRSSNNGSKSAPRENPTRNKPVRTENTQKQQPIKNVVVAASPSFTGPRKLSSGKKNAAVKKDEDK